MDQPLTKAKRIPRNEDGTKKETFVANGNTYRWLDPADIGIKRWTELSNYMDVLYSGFDSYAAIVQYLTTTNKEVVKLEGVEAALYTIKRNNAYLDNIVRNSQDRTHLSMHICACICLRQGDDIRHYSYDRGEQYVQDWIAEGYSHTDFFGLAGSLSSDFKDYYQAAQSRMEKLSQQLKAVIATSVKGAS